uniref:Uncharacterized protein n=1 Tax=Anguilla anguilla TaxID=7936 RepID=A0A0E9U1A1_ANGAN
MLTKSLNTHAEHIQITSKIDEKPKAGKIMRS